MKLLLILTALPIVCFALIDTQVTVTYSLRCDKQPAFWYEIQLLEEDLHADDLLAKTGGQGQGVVEGVITGRDNGDPGNEYEFFIWVKSNCGANGKTKRVELRPVCLLGAPTCDYNISTIL